MFCTKFVQFSSLDLVQSNLQRVTFALRLDHVTVVAALTPKMQNSARRACLRSNFNFGSNQTTPLKLKRWSLKRVTLVTLSLCWGCLTITAAVSSSVDAYVCRIWTNPATCVRSTVSLSDAEAYYRAPSTFSPSLKSRRKRLGRRYDFETLRPLVWKIAFLAVALELSLKWEKWEGDGANQWFIVAVSDITHLYRLPASVLLYTYTGCQPVCDLHTSLLTVQSILDNIGCWLPSV